MARFGITERGDAAHHIAQLTHDAALYDGCIWITKAPHAFKTLPPNVILHCTITGFGGTYIEPGVQPADKTLEAYDRLIDQYGGERVVLRVDPIIPTPRGMDTALAIIARRRGRVRISYIDNYPNLGFKLPWTCFHAPYRPELPDTEICGEPGLDCTGCISQRDFEALGLPTPNIGRKGQRAACRCLACKVELLRERKPCEHGCLYCYWRR